MKKIFFILFILPLAALAQKDYKTHTVGPKESLSSIGRLYNINGRELANYNKIDYDKGLSLGQVLKIPIKNGDTEVVVTPTPVQTKPVQEAKPPVAKSGAAVYHTVEKKQTLYAISKLYSTTVDNIKKWNNLSDNALSEGAQIIVGYGATAVNSKSNTLPETKLPEGSFIGTVDQKGVTETPPPVVKQEVKTEIKEEPVKKIAPPPANNNAANFNGGVFKTDYTEQAKSNHIITESGNGGIFKSTSGWQDGKYYCLHNMATPGTIVKITNNANGKSIYAKVLDLMPDIKQNNGLVICVSNAAADVLGVTENSKLDCTLNYSK